MMTCAPLGGSPARRAVGPLLLAMSALCGPAEAQFTGNLAPRISLSGVSESVRADTFCVTTASGSTLRFEGVSASDADIGAAVMHARFEMEPALGSSAQIAVPGLASLPGITIIREDPDRIRFNAPLSSVNAAIAALEYRSASTGDSLVIIVDDLQLPPLSTEFVYHFDTQAGASTVLQRCLPPPDLRADADTGASSEDDITAAAALAFDVVGLVNGDVVDLINDGVAIAQTTATGSTAVIVDSAPTRNATGLYAISVNAGPASAALSVAVVDVPTYTISGTVNGLVGSGLLLQNNGGDDLPVAADGGFSFATALPEGSSYLVSVATQPGTPNQLCTVSQGSGSLIAANVTDVSVTCTAAYTVGGTVSGLAGSGLVLRNNGGDDLPVAADGGFTFPTALADGSAYEISVASHPAAPNQRCSVSSGSGNVGGANVTDVAIACVASYSIGGSVSGLVGNGLVLHNNGGDALAIAADGGFVFPVTLIDGAGYAVSVAVQPSTPAQTCTPASESGVVNGADVATVTVACVTGAFSLAATSGSGQVADFVTTFAAPLAATLLDAAAAPVANADVMFEAPASGASADLGDGVQPVARQLTVRTDANGVALVAPIANTSAGCYRVLAASAGSTDVAEFVLHNVNPEPRIFLNGFESPTLMRKGLLNCP